MRISDWSSDVCSSDLIHALLCAPGERRGISDLAYAHGFTSAAHFSRAFRNLFGYSARDVRDLARMRTIPRSRQARSEEHTSELQSLMRISYAVFCLKKNTNHRNTIQHIETRVDTSAR